MIPEHKSKLDPHGKEASILCSRIADAVEQGYAYDELQKQVNKKDVYPPDICIQIPFDLAKAEERVLSFQNKLFRAIADIVKVLGRELVLSDPDIAIPILECMDGTTVVHLLYESAKLRELVTNRRKLMFHMEVVEERIKCVAATSLALFPLGRDMRVHIRDLCQDGWFLGDRDRVRWDKFDHCAHVALLGRKLKCDE